jgi:acyl-CoA reductase-like NAD-dependent aldehyde dehydrogenase
MNQFQEIFDKQKAYFDSDATKSYEWRIDQLTRLENLCNENAEALEAAMSSNFKTASQEKVFEIMAPVGTAAFAKQELKEWMKPVDVVVPKALRESGHTAKVYRDSVVGGVVESWSIAKNIHGIFVPSQQSVRTEIRNLIPRVAGDGVRKRDF